MQKCDQTVDKDTSVSSNQTRITLLRPDDIEMEMVVSFSDYSTKISIDNRIMLSLGSCKRN